RCVPASALTRACSCLVAARRGSMVQSGALALPATFTVALSYSISFDTAAIPAPLVANVTGTVTVEPAVPDTTPTSRRAAAPIAVAVGGTVGTRVLVAVAVLAAGTVFVGATGVSVGTGVSLATAVRVATGVVVSTGVFLVSVVLVGTGVSVAAAVLV